MADTRPTKIGVIKKVQLCVFGIFSPNRLAEAEAEDNERRKELPQPPPPSKPRAFKIRRAFGASLVVVVSSIVVGFVTGRTLQWAGVMASSTAITILQVLGATLLLWGTLFVRGWDVQTYGGVTLTERVNQWIYRFLYWLGTAVIVTSLTLP